MKGADQDFHLQTDLPSNLIYTAILLGIENDPSLCDFNHPEKIGLYLFFPRSLSPTSIMERTKEMTLMMIEPHIAGQKPSI